MASYKQDLTTRAGLLMLDLGVDFNMVRLEQKKLMRKTTDEVAKAVKKLRADLEFKRHTHIRVTLDVPEDIIMRLARIVWDESVSYQDMAEHKTNPKTKESYLKRSDAFNDLYDTINAATLKHQQKKS